MSFLHICARKLAPWQLARLPEELRGTVLVEGNAAGDLSPAAIGASEPAFTIKQNAGGRDRAVLISNAKTEYGDGMAAVAEPAWSVTSQTAGISWPC